MLGSLLQTQSFLRVGGQYSTGFLLIGQLQSHKGTQLSILWTKGQPRLNTLRVF